MRKWSSIRNAIKIFEGEQRNEKIWNEILFLKECVWELFWVIIMRIEKFIYLENKKIIFC